MDVYIVSPHNVADCIAAALCGNESATWCLEAMDQSLKRIFRAKKKSESLRCLRPECTKQFDQQEIPLGFVVMIPRFPDKDPEDLARAYQEAGWTVERPIYVDWWWRGFSILMSKP
jgi:hypothetical protein